MGQNQLAIAGKAKYHGIDSTITLSYIGRSESATSVKAMVIEKVEVAPQADVAENKDEQGEMQGMRPTNDRVQVTFSCTPIGATGAAAQLIAEDLPKIKTLITVVSADAQIATPVGGSSVIDSVSSSYDPNERVVLSWTITHWIGKVFTVVAT